MTTEPRTRDRIIAAALELIAARGIAGVTMSSVAAEAGVARQTLYNHFPDVESIVVAAYAHHHAESIERLRQILAAASGAEAKLVQFIRYQVVVMAHSHGGSMFETGLSPAGQQQVHEQHQEVIDLVQGILDDGVGSGVFRQDLEVTATALFILHLMGACGDLAEGGMEVATIASAVKAMVLGGVQS
jgi:AcrR family transcriptional regulator